MKSANYWTGSIKQWSMMLVLVVVSCHLASDTSIFLQEEEVVVTDIVRVPQHGMEANRIAISSKLQYHVSVCPHGPTG
jgi:hypothetical protein